MSRPCFLPLFTRVRGREFCELRVDGGLGSSAYPRCSGAASSRRSSSEGIWLSFTPVRLVDWYLGLSLGQKIVVGVAGGALVLVGFYLASLLIFSVVAVSFEKKPHQGTRPEASARASANDSAI